ncbi:MAG: AMP-binding protein [Pseudomonadota bacterium]
MAGRRYPFSVLLAAAMLNGQRTVLPPARATGAVRQALSRYQNPLVIDAIDPILDRASPRDRDQAWEAATALGKAAGDLEISTSGSTGLPVAHHKTWHMLDRGALLATELIARAGMLPGECLVAGTTPHQHMYGLEASVFTGLAHGHVLYDTPVFYPADLEALDQRAAEAGLDAIALVTSPPHLKFLAEKIRALPRIRCVLSATAPLSRALAEEVDTDASTKVFEIYGSTETGSLAWRRTVSDDLWTPLDGFQVLPGPDGWRAAAPHLPEITPLSDEIELAEGGRFRLAGRRGDMVRVAGKRHSLGALNAVLAALPMIADGAVLRETVEGEDRLHMFVVPKEPEADRRALIDSVKTGLRETLDSVFVPRRIHVVDSLPRNETGKISSRDAAVLIATGGRAQGTQGIARKIGGPTSG